MENKLKNDILYVCTLIEYIGRETKNRRSDVVMKMGIPYINHLLKYADVNHCLDLQQVADETIEEAGLDMGDFDTVSDCKYQVPGVTAIGKVYQRLIIDVRQKEEWAEVIYNVFQSYISDEISNFNGSVFYSVPEYLKYSYLEGMLLT